MVAEAAEARSLATSQERSRIIVNEEPSATMTMIWWRRQTGSERSGRSPSSEAAEVGEEDVGSVAVGRMPTQGSAQTLPFQDRMMDARARARAEAKGRPRQKASKTLRRRTFGQNALARSKTSIRQRSAEGGRRLVWVTARARSEAEVRQEIRVSEAREELNQSQARACRVQHKPFWVTKVLTEESTSKNSRS